MSARRSCTIEVASHSSSLWSWPRSCGLSLLRHTSKQALLLLRGLEVLTDVLSFNGDICKVCEVVARFSLKHWALSEFSPQAIANMSWSLSYYYQGNSLNNDNVNNAGDNATREGAGESTFISDNTGY